ncbi:hypothetical protein TPHA_0H02830 [Tetrapisispora phaffii CBS 4417]|uniref:DNA repair protein REV1 n=1 Tax=Tetrapisispora phaffii (strain ATCC 24235 / CBS 4417 / NBRC 1672 / NRRL Y-8282 / UCD 70-5) TaxID=1071381 RepID=G8BWN5_TETPH|nr:hypothetical protein TPHA_0H02830 [Tetrapisispora phaffii CBS 4417]CCE64486.1 hypothetical protein TPHA_0H02830 [Tetrapisispora phaffii CBS 4417]
MAHFTDDVVGNVENFHEDFISSLDDESLIRYVEELSQENIRPAGSQHLDDLLIDDKIKNVTNLNFSEKNKIAKVEEQVHSDDRSSNSNIVKTAHYGRGQYFRDKEFKQLQQDQKLVQENQDKIKIFKNCVIYINGYTDPDRLVLHKLIVIHGGKFLHHMTSKGRVTHIVATNLPLKKRVEFAKYKVITPEWILDSVKAEVLQPWQEYSLLETNDYRQPKLDLANRTNKNDNYSEMNIDCNSPLFVENYFKNSRLHHLSLWKSDLRDQFLKKYRDNKILQRSIPKQNDQLTILHIDFDSFFASVATLVAIRDRNLNINLKKDAILVCHGSNNSDIASCNYVARNLGIKNGMWVSHAKKLCPPGTVLTCLPYNFQEFEAASKILYNCLNNSGLFDMVLPVSIDEAICVMVNRNYSKNEVEDICKTVRSNIEAEARGCKISIGCANSLVLARLALKLAKPDGYHILDQDEFNNNSSNSNLKFWSQFKINDLPGIGYSIVQKLSDYFGLKKGATVEQLIKVSTMEKLKLCTGSKVSSKISLAISGKDDEESSKLLFQPLELFQRKTLSMEINWGIRFENIQQVDVFISRCVEYLLKKLQELQKSVAQITLKIMKRAAGAMVDPPKYMGMGKCDAFSRSSNFGIGATDHGTISTELKNLFRTLSCPPKELRGVSIQFTKLTDLAENINQYKLPFKKVISLQTVNNLPSDLKLKFETEIKRRNIEIKQTNKSPSSKVLIPKNVLKKYSPTKQEEDFLKELPTQIRNEVASNLIIEKKIKDSKVEDLHLMVQTKKNLIENSKDHFQGNNSIFQPISFQGQTSFKKICKLVREWVSTTLLEKGPHKRDTKLFKKYLLKLSNSNRLFLILQLIKLVSQILTLNRIKANGIDGSINVGFMEWEKILLKEMIPILNKSGNSFQSKQKLEFEFDI